MNWYGITKSAGEYEGEQRVRDWTDGALRDFGDPKSAALEMSKLLSMFEREVMDRFKSLARWKRVIGRYKRTLENALKEAENKPPEELNKPGEDHRTPLDRIQGFRRDVISAVEHQGVLEGWIRDQQQQVEDMKKVIEALQSRQVQGGHDALVPGGLLRGRDVVHEPKVPSPGHQNTRDGVV